MGGLGCKMGNTHPVGVFGLKFLVMKNIIFFSRCRYLRAKFNLMCILNAYTFMTCRADISPCLFYPIMMKPKENVIVLATCLYVPR